ncbi:MAG: hypothetical protein ACOYMY_11865 [Prochlorococcaceae cyanobacterium]
MFCCFAMFPWGRSIAQDINIQPCSFNGGEWIQARYVPERRGFRLDWSDGPKITYALASGDNAVIHYMDSLGGRWRYSASIANMGFTLYNPKNGNKIVCHQAVTNNAFDAGKTTQCFSVQKKVFTGDGTSLGYYRAHASLMESAGSALVSFSVSMPDTPQVLNGDKIKATRISPTTYKFRFVDGWGNSSKGLLAISGKHAKLTLVVEKYGSPSNVSRNYGETNLNSSFCK